MDRVRINLAGVWKCETPQLSQICPCLIFPSLSTSLYKRLLRVFVFSVHLFPFFIVPRDFLSRSNPLWTHGWLIQNIILTSWSLHTTNFSEKPSNAALLTLHPLFQCFFCCYLCEQLLKAVSYKKLKVIFSWIPFFLPTDEIHVTVYCYVDLIRR